MSSTIGLSTIHSFSDHPEITSLMSQLKKCKEENLSPVISKITAIAEILLRTPSLTPHNSIRASLIGKTIKEKMTVVIPGIISQIDVEHAKIRSIMPEFQKYKSFIQMEAIIFGLVFPQLSRLHYIYSNSELAFIKGEIPEIKKTIDLSKLADGEYKISIGVLQKYLEKFESTESVDSPYDLLMAHVASNSRSFEDGMATISLDFHPDAELLSKCLDSKVDSSHD